MDMIVLNTQQFPSLAYRKFGAGPAIVLLHGFPADGGLWEQILAPLATKFTVLVPDLPGSGESSFAGANLSMEQMAESVKLILDNEKIEKAVIAGHSMGGYTAMAFAELYPERLRGLSMVHSLATADDEEKKETRRKSIELIRKGGKEPFVKQMIPNLFSKEFKISHPEVIQAQIDKGMELKTESMVAFYNAMIQRPDRIRILDLIKSPVQWIAGQEDSIATPKKVLEQSKHASINFVTVYEDCAHMSMLEKPGMLIKDLNDFGIYCYDLK